MKYALLIYNTPENRRANRSDEENAAIGAEYAAIDASPEVYGGAWLQETDTATTVRVADGESLLTDGPFIDAKEFLGGFFLIEADDLDGALAIAARVPAARMGGAVEVRPLNEM